MIAALSSGASEITNFSTARDCASTIDCLRKLGVAFFAIDRIVVDGLVNLVSYVPVVGGFALKLTTQRGYLQGYAVTMLFGIAVILLVVFL